MSKLSENIKRLRSEKGYTLEELGKKINTSKQNIARYENGTIPNIPYDKITALAEAFGVTRGYLMGWEDNIDPETKNAALLANASADTDLLEHIRIVSSLPKDLQKCVYEIARVLSRTTSP